MCGSVKASCLVFFLAFFLIGSTQPDDPGKAELKTVRGKIVSFSSITQNDSLTLVCFWSTSSEESITELNQINSSYDNWRKNISFHLVAVSVDQGNNANRVRPTANMNEWKFDVLTDINLELSQSLHATLMPQSMILKAGKLLYQQSGYKPGSEKYLFQKMLEIASPKR
jgi:cytochrome c biogenesis protein CcmG, thiol:disulfide interchange protein DsbE